MAGNASRDILTYKGQPKVIGILRWEREMITGVFRHFKHWRDLLSCVFPRELELENFWDEQSFKIYNKDRDSFMKRRAELFPGPMPTPSSSQRSQTPKQKSKKSQNVGQGNSNAESPKPPTQGVDPETMNRYLSNPRFHKYHFPRVNKDKQKRR